MMVVYFHPTNALQWLKNIIQTYFHGRTKQTALLDAVNIELNRLLEEFLLKLPLRQVSCT